MERVQGEGEAHIRPDLQGRARRQAGLGGHCTSAEWAHAGAGNQTQVARRVLKRQRQKTSNTLGFLCSCKKKQSVLKAGAEGQKEGWSVGLPAAG